MTKTEKSQLFLDFVAEDKADAFDHEFTRCGAICLTDPEGNHVSISFHPAHIPAIEQLLNILHFHRGDYDDAIRPQIAERIAA
jgi:hypothetical protein